MKRPYDLTEMARAQGPVARAMSFAVVVLIAAAMLAFAVVRITTSGEVDIWAALWIVALVAWVAIAASIELLANRALFRAAREDVGSRHLVLFRTGQLISSDGDSALAINGWIALGTDDIKVTLKRRNRVLLRRPVAELAAARGASVPGSWGVLILIFGDGSRFESIPVEAGIHHVGLSKTRVEAIAADITRIIQA